jgi:hypothetical protein
VLEEVYNPVVFETVNGFRIAVCMRDDGYEIRVLVDPSDVASDLSYRIDKYGVIEL